MRKLSFESSKVSHKSDHTPAAYTAGLDQNKAKWVKRPSLPSHYNNVYFWHELLTFSIRRKMCSANSRIAPRPPLHLQMYPTAFWALEQASAGTALRPTLFRHSSSDTSLPGSETETVQYERTHNAQEHSQSYRTKQYLEYK